MLLDDLPVAWDGNWFSHPWIAHMCPVFSDDFAIRCSRSCLIAEEIQRIPKAYGLCLRAEKHASDLLGFSENRL